MTPLDQIRPLIEQKREGWDDYQDKLLNHTPTCTTLLNAWLPRKGGVTCPWDLWYCVDCDLTFFIEADYSYADWEELEEVLCICCAQARGIDTSIHT